MEKIALFVVLLIIYLFLINRSEKIQVEQVGGSQIEEACSAEPEKTVIEQTSIEDIQNPNFPLSDSDPELNTIEQQNKIIKEYKEYIEKLQGSCCRNGTAKTNLRENYLSNKKYPVRPFITAGFPGAMYLQTSDFSNIISVEPTEADKRANSFYSSNPDLNPMRTTGLQASERWPLYQRTFDRYFVSRIPEPSNTIPFKQSPYLDWPGNNSYCSTKNSCASLKTPPWTVYN